MVIKNNSTNIPHLIRQHLMAALTIICCFILANAQQPTPTPTNRDRIATPAEFPRSVQPKADEDEVIKVNSKLVVVPVSVIDDNGQPVKDLAAKDFRLEEEGQPQEISEVSTAEQVPLEIALLIDVSSSVNPLFEYEKAAAARFLQSVMRSDDRASVFLVGETAVLAQPRDNAEKTAETIRNIMPTKKYTAYFDAVSLATEYLRKTAPPRSRKVILSLSDGEDTYSKNTLTSYEGAYKEMDKKINTLTQDQRIEILNRYRIEALAKNYTRILRELQSADTVFYSVNPSGALLKINRISLRGQEGLQKFADETGGTAFLPLILPNISKEPLQGAENIKKNEEALEKIFQQIAAELRAQYLLQFYSEANFPSGKYVRLKAAVKNKLKLRVKARQGYFATTQ